MTNRDAHSTLMGMLAEQQQRAAQPAQINTESMAELQRRLAAEAESARVQALREAEERAARFQQGLREQQEAARRAEEEEQERRRQAAEQAQERRRQAAEQVQERRRRMQTPEALRQPNARAENVRAEDMPTVVRNQLLAAAAALRSTIETAKRQLADQEEQLANIERLLTPSTPAPSGDSDDAPFRDGERRLDIPNEEDRP